MTLILLALGAAAVWAASAYLVPFRDCRACGGTGRKGRAFRPGHTALCGRCGGSGHVPRPGSRLMHRAALSARRRAARNGPRKRP